MRQRIRRLIPFPREGLSLLVAFAVAILIGVLSYRGWTEFGRHTAELEITQQTTTGIYSLLFALKDAEAGQRGFLLTGDESYLAPYLQARADIPLKLKSLSIVTATRPDQRQRIESLNILVEEALKEFAQTIELRRNSGLDAVLAVDRVARGKALMDQARGSCSEIQNATAARLTEHFAGARSTGNECGVVAILGASGMVLLVFAGTVNIQKGLARRESVIGELQQGEKRLEVAVANAEAASRAKGMFLSTMSHQIRTPMNAILGYTQLLLRDPAIGAAAKTNLKIIGRSGEHLMILVNDVLDISRIEAGCVELNPVTFHLRGLMSDLEEMFRSRAEAKTLEFEMLVDGDATSYLIADEGKLRQAVINLLGNAIKFTDKGHVAVHVTLDRKSAGQYWLSTRVEDTGSGVADAEQGKLFEPFNRFKGEINTQEGTGLGLAISRQHARLMGGDLTVVSAPGEGSVFCLEIPVELGDSRAAIKRIAPRRVTGIRGGTQGPAILVVDDQFENRDWLVKLLASIGFSVRGAENGEAAIRTWEEWHPGLMLMDVHMPVMDGLEATRRIKANPRGKETAIVVLTASASEEDRRSITQSGADGFFSKPCLVDDLLEKIRAHLDVAYEYEGSTEGQQVDSVLARAAGTLAHLPLALVDALCNATAAGDKKSLDGLILQVRQTDRAGADVLQELASKYEYDALTRLLEQLRLHPPPETPPLVRHQTS